MRAETFVQIVVRQLLRKIEDEGVITRSDAILFQVDPVKIGNSGATASPRSKISTVNGLSGQAGSHTQPLT